jgi:hypothetical protein
MCPAHYDLTILVEYMRGRGEQIAVETVQKRLAKARANGGQWVITAADVETMLPAMMEAANA